MNPRSTYRTPSRRRLSPSKYDDAGHPSNRRACLAKSSLGFLDSSQTKRRFSSVARLPIRGFYDGVHRLDRLCESTPDHLTISILTPSIPLA